MFWYRGTRDEVLMLPRSMSRGTLGCIEGTRDEVLYAAALNEIGFYAIRIENWISR